MIFDTHYYFLDIFQKRINMTKKNVQCTMYRCEIEVRPEAM